MLLLKDEEIDLESGDLLNTKVYADALVEIIDQTPKDTPFTIGLFGEWGAGKSSIVKTFSKKVSTTSNHKVVTYDAWKYVNDSFRRMFLLKIANSLDIVPSENFKYFYKSKSEDVKNLPKFDWIFFGIAMSIFVVVIIWVNTLSIKWENFKMTIALIATLLALISSFLGRAFIYYKTTEQSPLLFAPEQFEQCFDEMVSSSLLNCPDEGKAKYWVKESLQRYEKIIFVIDNIDRCSKETALELITTVKNFLGKSGNLIFLIPVDDLALKGNLKEVDQEAGNDVEKYLRKFFNLTIRVKPFPRFDLFDFAQRINIENQFNFSPTTVDIIAKEFATNPRRIIQMFNNLVIELKIFEQIKDNLFVKEYESVICKMLVIREEWPTYYVHFAKRPNSINSAEFRPPNPPADLQVFLAVTHSVSQNIPPTVLEAIFSANDRDAKIVAELKEAIIKQDSDALYSWIGDNKENFETAFTTLLEKLNRGINRQLFKTEVVNIFQLICNLENSFNFTKYQHTLIRNEIEQQLNHFIPYITAINSTIKFIVNASKIGYDYLDSFLRANIIDNLNNDKNTINVIQHYRLMLVAFLENSQENSSLDDLWKIFTNDYEKVKYLPEYNFSEGTLRKALDGGILEQIIRGIQVLFNSDSNFNDTAYAAARISFTESELQLFVAKVHELHRSTFGVSHDDILTIINSINIIFNDQSVKIKPFLEGGSDLASLFKKFTNKRQVGGSNHLVLHEVRNIIEVQSILDFTFNIYRISGGLVDISSYLSQILQKNTDMRNLIVQKIAELPPNINKEIFSEIFGDDSSLML